MIQFDAGQGVVGRNVFQKLREFRKLHELQWGWQAKEFQKLNKYERGERIHNQKPNAVADIAAVLSGAGRGNLMWTKEPESPAQVEGAAASDAVKEGEEGVAVGSSEPSVTATAQSTPTSETTEAQAETKSEKTDTAEVTLSTTPSAPSAQADETAVAKAPKVEKKKAKELAPSAPKRLLKATVYWANDMDLEWARKWSDNVIHELGLPEGIKVWNWKTKVIREGEYETPDSKAGETKSKSTSATASKGKEAAKGEQTAEGEKKGWFGWLGGKTSEASQDARA